MSKDRDKIRNYRRLKRKAKRLRKRRAFFRFIFNKIFRFALLRFIFELIIKKYGWVTSIIFLLGLFYNAGNHFSTEQYLKLKESKIELGRTNEEVKRLQLFSNQQSATIQNLQKEILEWNRNYTKLTKEKNQESENLQKTIQQLDQEIQQFKKDNENLDQKNKKLKLMLISLKHQLKTEQEKFQEESENQKTLISKLEIQITAKDSELRLKQSTIDNLNEQLRAQEIDFDQKLMQIDQKVEDIKLAMTDRKRQEAFQIISILINSWLRRGK